MRKLLPWFVLAWASLLVGLLFGQFAAPESLISGIAGALRGPYDFTGFFGAWLGNLKAFVAAAWLWMAALGAGRIFSLGGHGRAVFSSALGMILIGLAAFGLGLLGMARLPVVVLLVAGFGFAGAVPLGAALKKMAGVFRSERRAGFFLLALSPFLGAGFIAALAPEMGWDALVYHLYAPARYLAAGRIHAIPYNLTSFFPFLTEMWFMLGQAIAGDAAAKCFNFSFLPISCLALVSLGRETGRASAGWLASLIYASVPGVLILSGQSYNDLSLSFLSFLAIWAASRKSAGGTLLAGAICGGALGCKYLGAWTLLACVLAWGLSGRGLWGRVRRPLLGCSVALLAFSPWLLRNIFMTGGPFYPLLPALSLGSDWNPYIPANLVPGVLTVFPSGLLDTALRMFRMPADISVHARAIGVPLSPLLLGLLPAIFISGRPRGAPGFLALGGLLSALLWTALGAREARYLVPAMLMLSFPAALAAAGLYRGPRIRSIWTACLIAAAIALQGAIWFGFVSRIYFPWRVALGLEPRDIYLSRGLLPNGQYHPLCKIIQGNLPKSARILVFADLSGHYLGRDAIFDSQRILPPFAVRLLAACRNPANTRKRLRQLGIEYVLYTPQALAMEYDCRCFRLDPQASACSARFWRRYAVLARAFGDLHLYRLRGEREAEGSSQEPWLDWPGVQEQAAVQVDAARSRRDWETAEGALENLRARAPDLAWIPLRKAELLISKRDFELAAREIKQARKLGADGSDYWLALALLRYRQSDPAGACKAALEAIERKPTGETYALYAMYCLQNGNIPNARAAIREALRLSPNHPFVRRIAGQLFLR